MAIVAKNENQLDFMPVSEGVHNAICIAVIDLGIQRNKLFNKDVRKIMITWELVNETFEVNGEVKFRTFSKEYTLSLGEKANLRKDLQAWRGKSFTAVELDGFDLQNILGKACQVQIMHTVRNEKTYANIISVMALAKGTVIDKTPETIYFDLSDINCLNVFDKIPVWMQSKIKESTTYKDLLVDIAASQGMHDELPF